MDSLKLWLAALAGEVVDKSYQRSKIDCPGCIEGLTSPLLHVHMLHPLREILQKNFTLAVKEVDVEQLFKNFVIRFGLFQLKQDEYTGIGRNFLLTLNADAIYYGRYVTTEYDQALYKQIPLQTYEPTPIAKADENVEKVKKKRKIAV